MEIEKATIEKINFDLISVLLREVGAASDLADEKGVSVSFIVSPEVPQCIIGDPVRLAMILNRLLDNAVKFTEQGSIVLTVNLPSGKIDYFSPIRILINIEDTGCGIDPEKMANLWGATSHSNSQQQEHGQALSGLIVCRDLVALMGGDISVKSELGRGSIFQLALSFMADQCLRREDNQNYGVHSHQLSILCAEDFATNQMIIRSMVEAMGHKIVLVENGIAAIEELLRNKYDLILMDGRMPRMDGAQAASTIRSGWWNVQKIPQANIPIIALTANNSAEQKAGYRQAGMNDIVMKPIDSVALFNALNRVITTLLSQGCQLESMAVVNSQTDHGNFASNSNSPTQVGKVPSETRIPKVGDANSLSQRLLVVFKTSLPNRIIEIDEAIDAGDMETLGLVFHGLKGSAAHLGDEALRTICLHLETAADAGQLDVIQSQLAVFNAAIKPYEEKESS